MTAPTDSGFPAAEPCLLAIETAGSRCSAAVTRGAAILAAESHALRHGHGEVLMPMVGRVMAGARFSPRDLDIVAVAIGPGGFTGIRVGLAAGRGIALALGARLIGVSGFAAVAHALARARGDRPENANLLVVLDSRREDLYAQLFAPGPAIAPLTSPRAFLPHHLQAYLAEFAGSGPLLIAGDAAEAAAVDLTGKRDIQIVPDSAPDALGVAAAAIELARSPSANVPVRPLYLRPPDVSVPKARGLATGAVA